MTPEIRAKYEAVIGLEVHAQMLTQSKAYSNDVNEFGAVPNSNVSAITLGHPGTLPKMNKKTIEFAIRLGIAVEADISENNSLPAKTTFIQTFRKDIKLLKILPQFAQMDACT